MNDILRACAKSDQIIIYGAGTIANILYLYLDANGFSNKILCFTVSEMGNNPEKLQGIDVIEIKKIPHLKNIALVLIAVQKILCKEIIIKLKQLQYRNYICVDGENLLECLYRFLYREPIVNNKILFLNMKGLGYGCNPKYIAQKLIALDIKKELNLVWAVAEENYVFPDEIRTVKYGTLDYYHELATAHIWIDNTRKYSDTRKREGQYYIQVWHGAAPVKKVEKDVEDHLPVYYIANAKRDSEMADLFLSGSKFYTNLYRSSFWYTGDIMKAGLPRQDIFFHATEDIKKKIYRYYGINEEYAMVLYAPTFRKDFSIKYYDLDIQMIIKALERKFHKRFVCTVSKHPDNRYLDYNFEGNVDYIAVDRYEDFEELLAAADVLITDYSGCMYDFSFTGRPVFLYQNDYKDYMKDRDFYFPMEELPYIKAQSNKELSEKIQLFDMGKYRKKLNFFMKTMGNYDDGNASDKVAKHILKIIYGEDSG